MAMFVLVVDTSLMNVSISAVVEDLDTTVSGVQSAIALEALVSAAFILIGSKVGDLFGRKRAYVLGLLGYAVGALAMALAQSLTAIIIFWAIVGGLGASLLLPAMQSLIHGNFEGAAQTQGLRPGRGGGGDRRRGRAADRGLHHHLPVVAGRVPARGRRHRDRAVRHQTRPRRAVHRTATRRRRSARSSPSWAWAASCWASWCGRKAASPSARSWRSARSRWPRWSAGCVRRKREGKPTLIDPDLFRSKLFRFGITGQMLQQIALGGTMIALPIYLQMVLEYDAMEAGLSLAPLSLSMFAVALLAGKKAGRPAPEQHHPVGIRAAHDRAGGAASRSCPGPTPAGTSWSRLIIAGSGLGLLVSQLNNYTLSPISEERVSEAAGVNSAAGSFGLSFGLAFAGAIMLATLSFTFTNMADDSTVLPPAEQAAGRRRARGRRRSDDATPSSKSCSPANPRRSRTRSSASTPTHDRSPFRSRCSSRSSPASSGCSTRSA